MIESSGESLEPKWTIPTIVANYPLRGLAREACNGLSVDPLELLPTSYPGEMTLSPSVPVGQPLLFEPTLAPFFSTRTVDSSKRTRTRRDC